MRASVVAELFHNDNYIMKKSFHSLGILTNIEKNINNFALAHYFLDCIGRKLQDHWLTATLSVVLKILKDSLLSSSYFRATHLSRASGTDSARDKHVPGNSCEKFKILLSQKEIDIYYNRLTCTQH